MLLAITVAVVLLTTCYIKNAREFVSSLPRWRKFKAGPLEADLDVDVKQNAALDEIVVTVEKVLKAMVELDLRVSQHEAVIASGLVPLMEVRTGQRTDRDGAGEERQKQAPMGGGNAEQ